MVNMPGLGTAARLAQALERLSVGLHFNLTYGSPLSERQDVPSRVGRGGRFTPVADPAAAGWSVAEIRRELACQWNAYQRTDLPLTHVDAHQFVDGHAGVFGRWLPRSGRGNRQGRGPWRCRSLRPWGASGPTRRVEAGERAGGQRGEAPAPLRRTLACCRGSRGGLGPEGRAGGMMTGPGRRRAQRNGPGSSSTSGPW